jgi:cephalosporin-C deacetylase-like acetyl esterase
MSRLTAVLHFGCLVFLPLSLLSINLGADAQERRERTLAEVKAEAITRAENGMYPLIGLDPADVREAFASITKMDDDDWAAAFIKVGDRYAAQGKAEEATDPAKASAAYLRAWRVYSFGRWPTPSSSGKRLAYSKALEAFLASARLTDPPLEVVRIPFEGSEIVGYLRLPKNVKTPVPLVIAISGLDSRKEDMSVNFSAILPYGIGYFAVDSPGTGQSPIKASETAERIFSRVIDYLLTRPEVDATKIAVDGQSFGGYWATKLSIVERARLKAVVAQSPPVHASFQKDSLMNSVLGNREYLFGLVPATLAIFQGAKTVDDLAEIFPRMSLVSQNLIGRPTSPMLIIAGALDTQVPISEAYLLLSNGDVPKEAWINPKGGHLGRQVKVLPDPVIFRTVIIPWLVRALEVQPMHDGVH